jgi:hypothetical protein
MQFHSLFFGFLTLFDISFYIYKTPKEAKHSKSITLFFHLYFCIMSSFIYTYKDLINCSFIYFISDSFINIYYAVFKEFNKYHHIFVLILLYFNEYLDKNLINMTGIHEISTIVLCLIDLNIISKNTFEILFPISFVLCRIIIFNINVFIYLQSIRWNLDYINYTVLCLLNIMNVGIVIKMRLLQKIICLKKNKIEN